MTKEQKILAAYRKVFDVRDAAARIVWADLAKRCWFETPLYAPGDSETTIFREGQRSVFLQIKHLRDLTDEDLAKMSFELKNLSD